MASTRIYLDHSTAAPPSPAVLSAISSGLKADWATTASPHRAGQELLPKVEEALRALYRLVGASEEDDVVVTSSAAEGVSHVVSSAYYDVTRTTGKNHFVVGSTDEAASILSTGRLEPLGCVTRMAPANKDGVITAEAIAESLTPRTVLVSLSWANGLTGVIQPVADIAAICRKRGVLFHLDATHVLGKLFFDLKDIGADFITFNGSQLHGPQGIGALYIRKGIKISPLVVGGNEQAGLRAGALNVPLLAAFGVAAREAADGLDFLCTEVARLRDLFERTVVEGCTGAFVAFKNQERVPHCTTIAFPGVANEALLYALDSRGVYGSMGGGHFQQVAMNLAACGMDMSLAQGALSFSLGRTTTEAEISRAAAIVIEEYGKLSKMSSGVTL